MKAYTITTGALFALLTVLHIMRMFAEGRHVAADPFYLAITAAAAAFCIWAFYLVSRSRKGSGIQ